MCCCFFFLFFFRHSSLSDPLKLMAPRQWLIIIPPSVLSRRHLRRSPRSVCVSTDAGGLRGAQMCHITDASLMIIAIVVHLLFLHLASERIGKLTHGSTKYKSQRRVVVKLILKGVLFNNLQQFTCINHFFIGHIGGMWLWFSASLHPTNWEQQSPTLV